MSQLEQIDEGDQKGDIKITNNRMSLVTGQAEVRQRIKQNLKTFLEEWFLDTTIGLPYHQLIFVKGTPPSVISDYFKDEILNVRGVTELKSFDPLDLIAASRQLQVTFEALTPFGETTIQEQVP